MSNHLLVAKNIIMHMHHSNVVLISDREKDIICVIDFIFAGDFDQAMIVALDINRSPIRTFLSVITERIVRYNSIKCLTLLYAWYAGDDVMMEKITRYLLLQACDLNNTYMIHVAIAFAVKNRLDMSNIILSLTYHNNKYDTIGQIIRTFRRYNVDLDRIEFEWEFLCKIYEYDPELCELCVGLQFANTLTIDDTNCIPATDKSAHGFLCLIFKAIRTINQNEIIELMENVINRDMPTCANLLFSKLDDDNKNNIITNAIIKDKVNVLRFLHGAVGIGPLHAYLCDLCVIHVAIRCLRYLIERVGLRPTQTTYNLCMQFERARWYGDYIKAYLP
ncbi:hypothetical protein F-E9_183 [Faustovirus]|nr:hypothetical protein F-E9_183 [Faustovirus]